MACPPSLVRQPQMWMRSTGTRHHRFPGQQHNEGPALDCEGATNACRTLTIPRMPPVSSRAQSSVDPESTLIRLRQPKVGPTLGFLIFPQFRQILDSGPNLVIRTGRIRSTKATSQRSASLSTALPCLAGRVGSRVLPVGRGHVVAPRSFRCAASARERCALRLCRGRRCAAR